MNVFSSLLRFNSFMMEGPIIYKPIHNLQSKSMDSFLYERALRQERGNENNFFVFCKLKAIVIEKYKLYECYTA